MSFVSFKNAIDAINYAKNVDHEFRNIDIDKLKNNTLVDVYWSLDKLVLKLSSEKYIEIIPTKLCLYAALKDDYAFESGSTLEENTEINLVGIKQNVLWIPDHVIKQILGKKIINISFDRYVIFIYFANDTKLFTVYQFIDGESGNFKIQWDYEED